MATISPFSVHLPVPKLSAANSRHLHTTFSINIGWATTIPTMTFCKGKVIFCGDTGVGKTSIIYHQNKMSQEGIQATIASSSLTTKVEVHGQTVTLTVWDTAGQEDYRVLIPMYAHYSHVAVIVFDVSRPETFDSIPGWLQYLKDNADIPYIFLVGNKMDIGSQVAEDKVYQLAEENGLRYFPTSAKTGQNIDFLFAAIAEVVQPAAEQPKKIDLGDDTKDDKHNPHPEKKKNCQC